MDQVTDHDTHLSVYQAALSLLETYQEIMHDIHGDPEERPMVLTQANRERFLLSLSELNKQVQAHGMPIAHSDRRPYAGESARGAVAAMCAKLSLASFLLRNQRGDDPDLFGDLLSGLSVDAWIDLVRDQATRQPQTWSPPKHADATEFTHNAEQFAQFAVELQACRTGLRDNASSLHLVDETRTILASAGALLVDLVRRHAVVAPAPAPPWLAWLNSGARLQFGRLVYGGLVLDGSDKTFAYMLKRVDAARSFDTQALRGLEDPDHRLLHNRHIFLEAVRTWLGSRCTPPVQLQLPTGRVEVNGAEIGFVTDWAGGTVDQANLMRNIGRAAETVCKYLAYQLRLEGLAATPTARPITSAPSRAPAPNPSTAASETRVSSIEAARIAQSRAPAQDDHVEKWVLDVLRQEPNRSFKLKDLMSARRRPRSEPCPVARSALSEALARLRSRHALGYSRFRYSHKQD